MTTQTPEPQYAPQHTPEPPTSYMPGATAPVSPPPPGYGPPFAPQPWPYQGPPQSALPPADRKRINRRNWVTLGIVGVFALVAVIIVAVAAAISPTPQRQLATTNNPAPPAVATTAPAAPPTTEAAPKPPAGPVMHGLNEPVTVTITGNGTARITIDQAKIVGDTIDSGEKYIAIHVTVESVNGAAYNPFFFKLKDADGAEYDGGMGVFADATPRLGSGNNLPAGQKASGWISFDSNAPQSALHGGIIEYGLMGASTYWKLP